MSEDLISDRMKLALLSIGASCIFGLTGWAVNIGSGLQKSIADLTRTVEVLTYRVDNLPPPELKLRLEYLESELKERHEEDKRLQVQIDRVEQVLIVMRNGKGLPPLGEYTD